MNRLDDLGVVEVLWTENKHGTVFAEGLRSYIVDSDNILTVIGEGKSEVRECVDFCHAVAMIYASEAVCRWNLRDKRAKRSDFNPARGRITEQLFSIEVDLYQAYDLHQKEMAAHGQDVENYDRLAEGIAHALGIMKGTTADVEWAEIEEKWKEANGA